MRAHIYNAGAGAGKTFQLAYKYISDAIGDPSLYRRILAVTFTNKATEQMKSRILDELYRLTTGGGEKYMERLLKEKRLDEKTIRTRAAEVLSKVLHDYSHFTVLTIDKFFQRILRAFIRELNIDLDYTIELETDSILEKSTDTLIENITSDAELRRWMSAFASENIESGHRWDIRKGILALGSEIFKEGNKQALESAPDKQTLEQIVNRATAEVELAYRGIGELARQAMAVMERAGIGPSDFAGRSRSFAHYFRTLADGQIKPPTATARQRALSTDGWCAKGSPAAVTAAAAELQPLLEEICRRYDAVARMAESAAMLRQRFRSFGVLADLYSLVRDICEQENSMILSETKYMLSKLIADNDAPFIYEKVGNRFERLMIDEFQDTSVKEWENFLPLLRNAMAQSDQTSVFIVGDVKQSIYRWRGGDWRILAERAVEDLRPENTEVEPLDSNYRSLPYIVRFNNSIITSLVDSDSRALDATIDQAAGEGLLSSVAAGELRGTLMRAYRDHSQTPCRKDDRTGYVRVETFADGTEPPVTEYIASALERGYKPSDILILVRGNSDGVRMAELLLQYRSRHPDCGFDVMTQEALIIGSSAAVCFIIAAMKLATDPADTVSLAVWNNFRRRPVDTPPDRQQSEFFRSIRLLSPEEAFERIVMHEGLQDDTDAVAYIQALHEQILGYCAGRVADIPLFVRWWEEQGCSKSLSVEQSESTIEIMTIHKAKGLERPVVIIPWCSWSTEPYINGTVWAGASDERLAGIGSFPVSYNSGMGRSFFSEGYYREKVYSHVDNMNILYVALTRAGEELYVAIPQNVRDKQVGRLVLDALERRCDEPAGEPSDHRQQQRQSEYEFLRSALRTDTGDGLVRYEFGQAVSAQPHSNDRTEVRSCKLTRYPSSSVGLRLRLPSQRYFDDDDTGSLSPRDFGILMHRAFEQAAAESDIYEAVERMRTDGVLDDAGAARLRASVAEALADPTRREWFSGKWEQVRTEADIVLPAGTARSGAVTKRPDRVMISGSRAVVVDYKFGTKAAAAHRRQIGGYMSLLREMGFTQVEGYIWYVTLGRTVRVDDAGGEQ